MLHGYYLLFTGHLLHIFICVTLALHGYRFIHEAQAF